MNLLTELEPWKYNQPFYSSNGIELLPFSHSYKLYISFDTKFSGTSVSFKLIKSLFTIVDFKIFY